jgi:hypothetical protein
MSYVWEEELMPIGNRPIWKIQHHLKKCLPKNDGSPFKYKVTVAWVTKIADRKWDAQFVNHNGSRTFRSLKAAKAYAVAIITLENTNDHL